MQIIESKTENKNTPKSKHESIQCFDDGNAFYVVFGVHKKKIPVTNTNTKWIWNVARKTTVLKAHFGIKFFELVQLLQPTNQPTNDTFMSETFLSLNDTQPQMRIVVFIVIAVFNLCTHCFLQLINIIRARIDVRTQFNKLFEVCVSVCVLVCECVWSQSQDEVK